ncbi:MAG: S8 family serine peptidase, partial [Gammaproteobacteria bacterium]|nr:S8 family serine peptidase [Gammaproteobacteria bacterium]
MKIRFLATVVIAALIFVSGTSANASWSFGRLAKAWDAPAAQHNAENLHALPARALPGVKSTNFRWEKGLSGSHRYIIRFDDAPLSSYRGDITGLTATNPDTLRAGSRSASGVTAVSGNVKLDIRSAASIAYLAYLDDEHGKFAARLQNVVAETEVIYRYKYAFNGMTVRMTQEEAARVSRLHGVAAVQRDFMRQLNTANSVDLIGAPAVWDGSATAGLEARGEGVLVGIIDTGINTDHPSFAEVSPGDGYVHTNPLGDGVFLRDCAPFDPVTNPNGGHPELCNNKLIGTMGLEDLDGHGSHAAGVAVGNLILDVPFVDAGGNPTGLVFDQISGVAPRANIVAYLACGQGGCQGADLIAAIDAATADGVDVINYSIGGGPDDPWNDGDSLALLGSRDAGIFVATSVGQSGPSAGTIGSPANAPWLTSAAASTHQRGWSEKMIVELTGGDTTPPGDIPGRSATGGYGPAPIVYAGDFGDPLCPLGAFAPGTFNAA